MIYLAAAFIFFAWYAIWGRTWLKPKPWMQWLYASRFGEWVEITFWKKSETIFYQRGKQLLALALALLPQIGAIDVSPYVAFLPERHRWWIMLIPSAALALDALVGEMLRNRTTKPLELVALPANAPPEVAGPLLKAEVAKHEAIVAVEIAKEQEKV